MDARDELIERMINTALGHVLSRDPSRGDEWVWWKCACGEWSSGSEEDHEQHVMEAALSVVETATSLCPECDGDGHNLRLPEECPDCDGTGNGSLLVLQVLHGQRDWDGDMSRRVGEQYVLEEAWRFPRRQEVE